ncbi:hypothetical protein IV38_GL001387 [Lactobacillus selangorensis]|uniref:HTH marR-type domain-containing protein n=1 Tax=Lactobacillus selangorensis TaxID=81857 RepID=A0A0R2FUE8_9LACO|nr:MarR family transcriptional regulator [Lactobacillus selangorensis]KRN28387.1 hypothetical protein IV38_GL001387 [Lactobacillus selangorensis]KRN31888.1 hypothetical protein IV40_GL001174 [Lactobacillus selangorensis]
MEFSFYDPLRSGLAMNRIIRRELNRRLKPFGLNDSNFFFIFILLDNPGISQDDLTKKMSLDHSTVTRAVAKLIDKGIITRSPNPNDKRASQIYPTDKAAELCQKILPIVNQIYDKLFAGLNDSEQEQLEHLLNKALASAQKEEGTK